MTMGSGRPKPPAFLGRRSGAKYATARIPSRAEAATGVAGASN